MSRRSSTVIILSGLLLLSVAGRPLEFPDSQPPPELAPVVKGNNNFTFELFHELGAGGGNLFFSPYSIASVMAMARAGARGNTATELEQVFHFPADPDLLHAAMEQIRESLDKADRRRATTLNIANALWVQRNMGIVPEYRQRVEDSYKAELFPADFQSAPGSVAADVNAWVSRETRGKIKQALSPGAVNPLTRMVLVNAIYFKSDWAIQFDEGHTVVEPFTTASGDTVDVPLMHQQHPFRYAETDVVQILELPYREMDFSMIFLLPREVDGLAEVEARLDGKVVREWIAQMKVRDVNVTIPRFSLNTEYLLVPVLASLGMRDAFDVTRADFSGISPRDSLFLGAIQHLALVEVDEEGTRAAASTAAMGCVKAAEPAQVVFRADHPFLFLIRDNHMGTILFLGRLANPAGCG